MRAPLVAMIAVIAFAVGHAYADPKADAKKLADAADTAYQLGKFAEAADGYEKAYKLFPAPGLLFNLGQCHRNLKHYETAKYFYEGWLRAVPANHPNRPVVEGLVREVTDELQKQQAEAAAERDKAAAAERDKAALEQARLRAAEAEALRKRAEEDDARRRADEERRAAEARDRVVVDADRPYYKRWWFWPAVGGAALAVTGTVLVVTSGTTLVEPSGSLGGLDRR